MKKVALIIGHSQQEQGASNHNGMTEWAYNSMLVGLIAEKLKQAGGIDFEIVNRTTLKALPEAVNETDADIAISFHANAFNTRATGSEVLYWHSSDEGKALSERINWAICEALGLRNRGLKSIKSGERGAYLLQKTTMPCVILEPFFIDNDKDLKAAMDKQIDLADAIFSTIMYEYLCY